jgi:hypothetical protein
LTKTLILREYSNSGQLSPIGEKTVKPTELEMPAPGASPEAEMDICSACGGTGHTRKKKAGAPAAGPKVAGTWIGNPKTEWEDDEEET